MRLGGFPIAGTLWGCDVFLSPHQECPHHLPEMAKRGSQRPWHPWVPPEGFGVCQESPSLTLLYSGQFSSLSPVSSYLSPAFASPSPSLALGQPFTAPGGWRWWMLSLTLHPPDSDDVTSGIQGGGTTTLKGLGQLLLEEELVPLHLQKRRLRGHGIHVYSDGRQGRWSQILPSGAQ